MLNERISDLHCNIPFDRLDRMICNLSAPSKDTIDTDDFLPIQAEFVAACRDRAFSWDVNFEEGIHGEGAQMVHTQDFYGLSNPTIILKANSIYLKDPTETEGEVRSKRRKENDVSYDKNLYIKPKLEQEIKLEHHDIPFGEVFALDAIDPIDVFKLEADPFDRIPLLKFAPTSSSSSKATLEPLPVAKNSVLERSNKFFLPDDVAINENLFSLESRPKTNFENSLSLGTTPTERRLGVYTKEERKQRIDRFRQKKMNRIWKKQIKYDCRKRLADTRPRIKGRFVSRGSPDHLHSADSLPDIIMNCKTNDPLSNQIYPFMANESSLSRIKRTQITGDFYFDQELKH